MTRTTIVLEDRLVERIKRAALKRRVPMREVISELLSKGLDKMRDKSDAPKAVLHTFNSPARIDINDRNALYAKMGERL